LLEKVAQNSVGLKLAVKVEDIVECTNPRKIIETYKVQGGPSPVEVERALTQRNRNLLLEQKKVSELKQELAKSESKLETIVDSYSLSNAPNANLKNLNL
jgi:hypothetical protein